MKIRNGFVSNSSASSFCIYGFEAKNPSVDDCIEILKKIKANDGASFIATIDEILNKLKERDTSSEYVQKRIKGYELIKRIDEEGILDPIKERGCEHKIEENANFCPVCGKEAYVEEESKNFEALEYLLEDGDTFFSLVGLEYHWTEWAQYVGRSWCTVKDNETGADFKASVEKIAKYFDASCSTMSEAWYNG